MPPSAFINNMMPGFDMPPMPGMPHMPGLSPGAPIFAPPGMHPHPLAPGYGRPPIVEAVLAGQPDQVRQALQYGENPHTTHEGQSVLHLAIEKRNLAIVKLLVGAHADVNALNRQGMTCAHVAAQNGLCDILQCLIDANVNINVVCNGYTPLLLAAEKGHNGTVELLAKAGANLGCMLNGKLPYDIGSQAVKNTIAEIVAELPPTTPFSTTCTLLHHYGRQAHARILKELLSKGYTSVINARDEDGNTAVHLCALANSDTNRNALTTLMLANADLTIPNNLGMTPLMSCAGESRYEACVALLAGGASASACNANGRCARDFGQRARRSEKLMPVLNAAHAGRPAVFFAVEMGNKELIARAIQQTGVNVCFDVETPLIVAINSKSDKIIEFVLEQGANPSLAPPGAPSPLQCALQTRQMRIAELLLKAGADPNPTGKPPLVTALEASNDRMALALLVSGAWLNVFTPEGLPVLQVPKQGSKVQKMMFNVLNNMPMASVARDCGLKDIFEARAKLGIQPQPQPCPMPAPGPVPMPGQMPMPTPMPMPGQMPGMCPPPPPPAAPSYSPAPSHNHGPSPFFQAVLSNNVPMARQLALSGTFDANEVVDGACALHHAVRRGNLEMMLVVIGAGASVEARDCNGATAVDLARQRGDRLTIDICEAVAGSQRHTRMQVERQYMAKTAQQINSFGTAACN